MILSYISEQHLNKVGVRRRIGIKIVEPLSVYLKKKCKLWVLITCRITKCFGRFSNLLRVKLSFTLERAASNEYPLQTFSLRNKKKRVGYPLFLVRSSLYCKDILASENRGIWRKRNGGDWHIHMNLFDPMHLAKRGHNFVTFWYRTPTKHFCLIYIPGARSHFFPRERSGSVVECLTRDRRAASSSLTGVTALWSLSKTHLS